MKQQIKKIESGSYWVLRKRPALFTDEEHLVNLATVVSAFHEGKIVIRIESKEFGEDKYKCTLYAPGLVGKTSIEGKFIRTFYSQTNKDKILPTLSTYAL